MIMAYQGEPGAYSEGRRCSSAGPATETLPCKTFDDVFEAVAEEAGDARRGAARELDRRHDPPQLRPAARARPVDHRRGGARRRPLPAGAAGHDARRREGRLLASAGAGAVRALSEGPRRRPSKRSTTPPAAPSWWPSRSWPAPRRSPRGGRPRCSGSRCCRKRCRTTSSTSRASPSSAASPPRRQQDDDGLRAAEHAGRAVQGAERVRAARHQPDQARPPRSADRAFSSAVSMALAGAPSIAVRVDDVAPPVDDRHERHHQLVTLGPGDAGIRQRQRARAGDHLYVPREPGSPDCAARVVASYRPRRAQSTDNCREPNSHVSSFLALSTGRIVPHSASLVALGSGLRAPPLGFGLQDERFRITARPAKRRSRPPAPPHG